MVYVVTRSRRGRHHVVAGASGSTFDREINDGLHQSAACDAGRIWQPKGESNGNDRAGPRSISGRLDLVARGAVLRAAGHTVFAPSLDGCAERRHALRPGITTETHGAEIADLLFFEDLHDVVLVGTSSGGMVACRAAELARERIGRVVWPTPSPCSMASASRHRQALHRPCQAD